MIGFKQFLSERADEELTISQLRKKVEKDCATWLKRYPHITLFRGMSIEDRTGKSDMTRTIRVVHDSEDPSIPAQKAVIGAVRPNRRPRDLSINLTVSLDEIFREKVGLPLRSSSLFVVKSRSTAQSYGQPFIILPIGEFHFAWSPYMDDPYNVTDGNMTDELADKLEELLPQIQKKFKNVRTVDDVADDERALAYAFKMIPDLYQFDSGMNSAGTNTEIMLVCDKYYALPEKLAFEILL